jgi:hypothetical protein
MFRLKNQEEHRLEYRFSEPGVWGIIIHMKNEWEHGHLGAALSISVAGKPIAPADIESIEPIKIAEAGL